MSRPLDIAFRVHMVDPGFSESVAVADFNKDGRLDILSAEYWYEAPNWTKHKVRDIPFNGSYIDNFSDLPVDVDGDGYTDVVQIAYFARKIVWLKNPGKAGGPWIETEIDAVGPTEFAFLVDLNNDGKALEVLPQFTGAGNAPLSWYELQKGKWVKHVVSSQSHGHGIGAGDVNGDKRNDIITPQGWFEAPADIQAPGNWTLHATDWSQLPAGPPAAAAAPVAPAAASAAPQAVASATPQAVASATPQAVAARAYASSSRAAGRVRLHVRGRRQQRRPQRRGDDDGAQLWRVVVRADI